MSDGCGGGGILKYLGGLLIFSMVFGVGILLALGAILWLLCFAYLLYVTFFATYDLNDPDLSNEWRDPVDRRKRIQRYWLWFLYYTILPFFLYTIFRALGSGGT